MEIPTEIPTGVLVILPARNEENTISQIIMEIQKLTRNVLVVDDNSKDQTPSIARSLGAFLIGTAGRPGYGSALTTGFTYARKHGFSTVVTLDADGAHNPSQIPELYYVHERSGCCLTIRKQIRFRQDARHSIEQKMGLTTSQATSLIGSFEPPLKMLHVRHRAQPGLR